LSPLEPVKLSPPPHRDERLLLRRYVEARGWKARVLAAAAWDGVRVVAEDIKFKTSYVSSEVRSAVVTALLAVRAAQGLPTWRVRSAAADLGVSPRTLWRWLEVAEREGRTTRRPRARFVVDQAAMVDLAGTAATSPRSVGSG